MVGLKNRDPFASVIVGIDARERSRDALALARQLASDSARVAPAHVVFIDPSAPLWGPRTEQTAQWERRLNRLRTCLAFDPDTEILCTSALSVGEGLQDLAVARQADLIVVGACARGRFRRLAIGDDTRSVLEQARVPVAVAPLGYSEHLVPRGRSA